MVAGDEFWQTSPHMQKRRTDLSTASSEPVRGTPATPESQDGPLFAGKTTLFPASREQPVGQPAAGPVPGFQPIREIGGPPGPEPTRFGDWEKKGRCIDF